MRADGYQRTRADGYHRTRALITQPSITFTTSFLGGIPWCEDSTDCGRTHRMILTDPPSFSGTVDESSTLYLCQPAKKRTSLYVNIFPNSKRESEDPQLVSRCCCCIIKFQNLFKLEKEYLRTPTSFPDSVFESSNATLPSASLAVLLGLLKCEAVGLLE